MASAPENYGRRDALLRLAGLAGLSATAAGLGFWLRHRSGQPEEPPVAGRRRDFTVPADPRLPKMAIIDGDDPRALVRAAIRQLGGIERFIARGDVVVIKPNMSWDRTPEQAANTNPEVVAETVRLCRQAGAGDVIVTDVSINEPRRCFERSGIGAAARAAGAHVILPEERRFREVDLRGAVLGSWPVLNPFLAADKVINIPIAKHHSLTGATLGMKNWYGILGGPRHRLHQRIHESLVDLAEFMRPTLTIVDACRVLLRNGPGGGSLADVAAAKTLVAGTDPVAVDAYAAKTWWDLDAGRLRYLQIAAARGLGSWDLTNVRTSRLTI
ncbi:MAG: DUF362 domain-containing protein [Bryobacteraceae bacterium]|jgi:uncharacterized protein (DUF362 family)